MQHPALQVADGKGVAFLEQLIELAAIAGKLGTCIESFTKNFLNIDDFCANSRLSAKMFVQIGCCRQVICVHMGLQNPLNRQVVVSNVLDDLVCRAHVGAAGGVVEIQHRIQDGTGLAVRITHHVTERIRRFVEEMLNDRLGHGIHL